MLFEQKRRTNILIGIAILLVLAGFLTAVALPIFLLVAFVFWIWGFANYAEAKGYSKFFGAFLSLTIVGVVIAPLLPDRHKGVDKLAGLIHAARMDDDFRLQVLAILKAPSPAREQVLSRLIERCRESPTMRRFLPALESLKSETVRRAAIRELRSGVDGDERP